MKTGPQKKADLQTLGPPEPGDDRSPGAAGSGVYIIVGIHGENLFRLPSTGQQTKGTT